jgi:hypothetical protein
MNKRILGIVTVVQLLGSGVLFAATSEFRSPLNDLQRRGHIHYDFAPLCPEKLWHTELWGAGYVRSAREALIGCGDDDICCTWNKSTTNKAELAKLFFGKECFRGEEAFANGIILFPEVSGNPALALNKLCPRFKYTEKGVFLGMNVVRNVCESNWHLGMRASIPVKVIDVDQARSCGSEQIEKDAGNVIVRRQEYNEGTAEETNTTLLGVNAYRLDFLSTLQFVDGTPLVNYGNGTTTHTLIAGQDINAFEDHSAPIQPPATAPMYVLTANDGKITTADPGLMSGTEDLALAIAADGDLPPDGSFTGNDQRLQFRYANNYRAHLALDREAQSKLFLVPSLNAAGGGVLFPEANIVQNNIDFILNRQTLAGEDSALSFFHDHGIDFCTAQHTSGVGDLYLEWYAGYEPECREWFWNGLFAFTIPTAKKLCDSGKLVYYQPTGNNGHFEFRLGTEGGWHPANWFGFRTFLSYNHVFQHTERRAPFFEGATVKNIPSGDPIPVKISYHYFLGNVDFTLVHPRCDKCGVAFGYELYARSKDKMCCCNSQATDFFGYTYGVDCCCCAPAKTNTTTHKIRGEFFMRHECCELFIGGFFVPAGRYAMREAEGNIGITIYF